MLRSHKIQSFVLKVGDSIYDNPNNNGPNLKIKNLYVNARMNWMMNHGTLKFTPSHMNAVLVNFTIRVNPTKRES